MSATYPYSIIPLTSDAQGQVTVNLGTTTITLVTRYNYSAQCWSLDIFDVNGDLMLAGIMMVP